MIWSNWSTKYPPSQYESYLRNLGHIYFGVLALMAILFYQERMLHLDTAHYLINLIYYQNFYTGQERYITYIPQVIPLGLLQLGASLKTILMGYSLALVLFFYLFYNLAIYTFQNTYAGLFIALSTCLMVRYKFYGPVGEILLSVVLLGLLIAFLHQKQPKLGITNILIALLIGASFSIGHPFMLVGVLIYLGIELILGNRWRDPAFWLTAFITGISFWYKYTRITAGAYEAKQISRLDFDWEGMQQLMQAEVWGIIGNYAWKEYPLVIMAVMLALIYFLIRKQVLEFVLFVLAITGMVVMVAWTHSYLSGNIFFMIDGYLSHIGVVVSLLLVYSFLPNRQLWTIFFVGLLMGSSLWMIARKHTFFDNRKKRIETIIRDHKDKESSKLLAKMESFEWEELWLPWAVGIESLLITSLDDPKAAKTLYYEQVNRDWSDRIEATDFFLSVHYDPRAFDYRYFPKHLIHLSHGPYSRIAPE